MTDLPTRRDRRDIDEKHRRPFSVVGFLGELLITAGVLALLFVAWQMWIGDWIIAPQRAAQANSYSQQWQKEFEQSPAPASPVQTDGSGAIPVLPQPGDGQVFATMHIPRFGSDYAVPIAGGTTRSRTLDPIGIGHYENTSMPGGAGNVALAGHRTTYGKPFNRIADLRIGDAIVIETPAGWYTYRFRTLEYVTPSSVDVLDPVPQSSAVAKGSYLTMTSCSPIYHMSERIIAYSVFQSFTPRADGPPSSLTAAVS